MDKPKRRPWSLSYGLIKPAINFWLRIYMRRVQVINRKAVPQDEAVLYASNHPNAFLDAVTLARFHKRQLGFLTRSDVFKPGLADRFFRGLHMLPVYRGRDAVDIQKKNEEVFQVCYDRLAADDILIIFVEGSHSQVRTQRPVKKGIARIGFGAEEKYDFKIGVNIVPVAFHYEKFTEPGGNLMIVYGNPFKLTDYKDVHDENPSKAKRLVKDRVEKELRELVIDIRNEEMYDTINKLREYGRTYLLEHNNYPVKGKRNLYNEFKSQKDMIAKVEAWAEANPEEAADFNEEAKAYAALLKRHRLKDYLIKNPWGAGNKIMAILALLITMPVFFYGWLHNFFPFWYPLRFAKKKVRDFHFHTSIKFMFAMILFPFTWFVESLLGFIFIEPWWGAVIYMVSLPLTGLFALQWWRLYRKLKAQSRYAGLVRKKHENVGKMQTMSKSIMERLRSIMENA